jgi:large subunit ribosomal protein L25
MAMTLKAEKRDVKVKPAKLAAVGKMPAVFYGKKTASTPVTLELAEFEKVLKSAGETAVIELSLGGEMHECLITDVARDPIKGFPRHADFYVFEKGQKLKIKVPIEFVGVAVAVKDLGGVLVKVMHELEIESAPKDLPKKIEVDIAPLVNFDSQILAKDIKLPQGVELITLADEVVASVYEPKEEKIEETAAPDLSAIEVEKKGKKEEEGVEGAAAGEKAPSSGKAGGDKK